MKKCMLKGLLTCILLFFAFGFTFAKADEITYTGVAVKKMTIRRTKSTSGEKIGEVYEGEILYIMDFDTKWAYILKSDRRGYVLFKNITDLSAAGGYDDEAAALYFGVADRELTLRAAKSKSAQKLASYSEGERICITSLEGDWLGVVKHGVPGYTLTKYVLEICPAKDGITVPEAYATMPRFVERYTAKTDLNLYIRKEKDSDSRSLGMIREGETISVMMLEGDWAYVRKGDTTGYVLAQHLKHFRRTDPFGPVIPGVKAYPDAAYAVSATQLFDAETGDLLFTVPEGAVLAIEEPLEDGSACLPYHRVTARVNSIDALRLEEAVPWQDAMPGEMLAVFSTYYDATSYSDLQKGRIFNINEGVRRIDGTVVAPGETFSFNALCAPYTKGNGYEIGPIINYVSSQKTGYSGGICQVSTTLYNAALQIPCEIVRQQPHSSYGIFYVPVDMDAAVGAGNLDLKLRNVLPYGVRIAAQTVGGVLTIRLYREG